MFQDINPATNPGIKAALDAFKVGRQQGLAVSLLRQAAIRKARGSKLVVNNCISKMIKKIFREAPFDLRGVERGPAQCAGASVHRGFVRGKAKLGENISMSREL